MNKIKLNLPSSESKDIEPVAGMIVECALGKRLIVKDEDKFYSVDLDDFEIFIDQSPPTCLNFEMNPKILGKLTL